MDDSTRETMEHIAKVKELIEQITIELMKRGVDHDRSKLESPEKESFDKFTPMLKGVKYMSEEYRAILEEMSPTLMHHYMANAHHPEHHMFTGGGEIDEIMEFVNNERIPVRAREFLLEYANSLKSRMNQMNLIDLLEMLADWKASTLRVDTGNMKRSLEVNKFRFLIGNQLYYILKNTIDALHW